jgi:AcrR family transcriptional regulator
MRGPGQRAGLTRAAVLAAARSLLAEGGVDALSMRALARRLDVAPNALYSHVQGKTQLLDDLLDDLLAAVEVPAPDVPDPVAGITALMTSAYEVLVAHPDLTALALARQGSRGPNAARLGVVTDALLARAGVPGPTVPLARRVLIVHIIGFAAFAAGAGDAPVLAAAEMRRGFDRGLGWLLAGMKEAPTRARVGASGD